MKLMRIALILNFLAVFAVAMLAQADQLTVFAIKSPTGTNWESPRSLLASTIKNSTKSSYSPSGHVMIRLQAGDKTYLTSMASSKKGQTFLETIRQGLGLSSLYYDFDGTLDSAETSSEILRKAFRDHRAAQMTIEIDSKTSASMVQFLQQWIKQGSYLHYRGGEIASTGKGAGCADFVMWFLNRALNGKAPLTSWVQELYLPKDLLEHTSPTTIYKRRQWAKGTDDGRFFMIPDPDLIYQWIVAKNPNEKDIIVTENSISTEPLHFSARLIQETISEANYPTIDDVTAKAMMRSIQVDEPTMTEVSNQR